MPAITFHPFNIDAKRMFNVDGITERLCTAQFASGRQVVIARLPGHHGPDIYLGHLYVDSLAPGSEKGRATSFDPVETALKLELNALLGDLDRAGETLGGYDDMLEALEDTGADTSSDAYKTLEMKRESASYNYGHFRAAVQVMTAQLEERNF